MPALPRSSLVFPGTGFNGQIRHWLKMLRLSRSLLLHKPPEVKHSCSCFLRWFLNSKEGMKGVLTGKLLVLLDQDPLLLGKTYFYG